MYRKATFRQLSAFHALSRLGSVARVASELSLTQPAISIQLKLLETAAGTPLTERAGRGVRLTAAGVLMAQYAGRILELWREAVDEMTAQRGAFSGTLRVAAVTTAEYLLPPLLVTFAGMHPNVKVKLSVGNRDDIVRMLSSQEIDIAIMGRPPSELKTVALPFAKHPMAFLAAPKHPLMAQARAGKLALEDLGPAKLLVRERGSGTRTTLQRLFKDAGVPLRINSELSSNEAIKQMCAAGFGVAFLSLHTCVLELQAGVLQVLPMAGNPLEREWFVMHLASRHLPQVAGAFEQFLVEHGQAEIQARLPFKAKEARVLKKPTLKKPALKNPPLPKVAARKTKALKT
jgi:LysR family transcriptional regulator, low CO2-responsive transcriptional regulator